jgi:hypothetical protein
LAQRVTIKSREVEQQTGLRLSWEVAVKRRCVLFITSVFAFIFFSVTALAQEKSEIVVNSNELNNGVVILHVQKAEKTFHLQCNQGAAGCTTLTKGKYQMVELPENYGMYECHDVEVYPETTTLPDNGMPDQEKKLGEYCLVQK